MMTTASAATATPRNAMLHQAIPEDIPFIKPMVDAAYSIYVERIGRPPAPMCEDWEETIKSHNVLVLKDNDQVVGSITFHVDEESDSLKIDNLVVHPAIQGRGYGRFLIDHAESEARRCALPGVSLFTNAKMTENIGLYKRLGFSETERLVEDGFQRVYFHKKLV